jgi:hypothetical protein
MGVWPASSNSLIEASLGVFGLDGAFRKGIIDGQMLTMCVVTKLNTYVPIAMVTSPTESGDAYVWLVRTAFETYPALRALSTLVLVSDRAKGLSSAALRDVFNEFLSPDRWSHVWCIVHLIGNTYEFCCKQVKNTPLKPPSKTQLWRLVWLAAIAPSAEAFEDALTAIGKYCKDAERYLRDLTERDGASVWAIHAARHNRHYQMSSNVVRSLPSLRVMLPSYRPTGIASRRPLHM